jgi:hypothetical protein
MRHGKPYSAKLYSTASSAIPEQDGQHNPESQGPRRRRQQDGQHSQVRIHFHASRIYADAES